MNCDNWTKRNPSDEFEYFIGWLVKGVYGWLLVRLQHCYHRFSKYRIVGIFN